MSNRWLVQSLIANAKRRGFIVESDDPSDGFSTQDFLALIDDVIRSRMVPLLKRTRESYLVKRHDVYVNNTTDTYAIPGRAAAEALKSILYEVEDNVWAPLNRIEAEEAHRFGTTSSSPPGAYYLEDDSVVFVPFPSTQTLRFLIFNRPNLVVEASEVARVYAFDPDANTVTLRSWDEDDEDFTDASVPSTFTATAIYDFVKGTPGFRNHSIDNSLMTAPVGAVLTFDEDVPANLAVGDFVCLAGETPIAQIPAELHPLLAQEVTRTLLEAKGDKGGAAQAEKTAARLEKDAEGMLSPRTTNTARYVQNYNAPGWNKGRRGW